MPEEWRDALLVSIPKKANRTQCDNTGMESACWMLLGRYLPRSYTADCRMLLKFYPTRNVASEQVGDVQT